MYSVAGLTPTVLAGLSVLVRASVAEAGRAVMRFYGSEDVRLSAKPDASPLTAADLASDALLREALAGLVPDCPVISEERASEWPEERRRGLRQFWLVDPLDGTKEFLAGNGEFCVCVALVQRGVPVLGVIGVPVTEQTYVGYRGAAAVQRFAAHGHETALPVLPPLETTRAGLRIAVSRHHYGPRTQDYLARYRSPVAVPMGSAIKFCAIAEGALDLYPRCGPTMAWDTAAGHCILGVAGRRVVDAVTGEALRYDRASLTNPGFVAGL